MYESPDIRELIAIAADGKSALHRLCGVDQTIQLVSAMDTKNLAERIKIGQLSERKTRRVEDRTTVSTGKSAVARTVLAAALQLVNSRRGQGLHPG